MKDKEKSTQQVEVSNAGFALFFISIGIISMLGGCFEIERKTIQLTEDTSITKYNVNVLGKDFKLKR